MGTKLTYISWLQVWLDQAVLTPAAVVFFFSSMTFLEGKGINEAKKRLESVRLCLLLSSLSYGP